MGTSFIILVPVFENVMNRIIGNGIRIAKAGRGGSLLKSVKNPFRESTVNKATQHAIKKKEKKRSLFFLGLSQPVLFSMACKPVKIIIKQIKASIIQRKPGEENGCFILFYLAMNDSTKNDDENSFLISK